LDVVFVWIGKNDRRIHAPLDRPLVSTKATVKLLTSISETLRSAATRVVFMAPLDVADELVAHSEFLRKRGIAYQAADISALRSAMDSASLPVVPIDGAFDGLSPADILELDGVHLNPRGQARLARWAAGVLASHLANDDLPAARSMC